jgi:hypothetical protein
LRRHSLDGGFVGHVRPDKKGRLTEGLNFLAYFYAAFFYIGDDNISPFLSDTQGTGPANSPRPPGNDRYPSLLWGRKS